MNDITLFDKRSGQKIETSYFKIKTTQMCLFLKNLAEDERVERSISYKCGVVSMMVTEILISLNTPIEMRDKNVNDLINTAIEVYSEILGDNITENKLLELFDDLGNDFFDDENIIVMTMTSK